MVWEEVRSHAISHSLSQNPFVILRSEALGRRENLILEVAVNGMLLMRRLGTSSVEDEVLTRGLRTMDEECAIVGGQADLVRLLRRRIRHSEERGLGSDVRISS